MKLFLHTIIISLTIASVAYAAEMEAITQKSDVKTSKIHNSKVPLAIRGADIETVSRVVIDGIPDSSYKIVPLNNKLQIIFEDLEYSFLKQDLLSIGLLNNIKKLSVIEKNNLTILDFEYSCACQGDFYKWYNQKLVLDVFSLDAVVNPLKVKEKKNVQSKITEPLKEEITGDKKNPQQKASAQAVSKDAKENDTPQSFEEYLQNLISKANKEGVIELKESVKEKLDIKKPEKPSNETQPKVTIQDYKKEIENKVNKINTVPSNIHISKNTVLTPEETEKLLPTDKNIFVDNDGRCLPDAAFKLPANDPKFDTFYDKISDYRNNLIGEFDSVNPEDALKLAYHYISYGLGEEALQVLSNFPTPEHRGHIAKSMAELLTNRPQSNNSIFKSSDNCMGAHSLWTAYRYFKLGNEIKAAQLSKVSNIADILRTFPVILQSRIGSSLALNLVRQGNYSQATELVNLLAKNTNQFNPNVLLVRGLIDANNGFADRALKTLEDVVDKTNGLDQQMAGLALAELKLASSIDLNQRDVSILEEVIFLKSRELIGVQALALIAESESRYGNFNQAFGRLAQKVYQNKQIKDPAEIKAEQLFKRIAISGEGNDNPNTLGVYWQYNDLIPKNPTYLKAFATRLYEKGYDTAAVEVLDNIDQNYKKYTAENDITFLKAQSLYRQGRYADVVQTMNKPYTNDPHYMQLKANAFHKIGQHSIAMTLLEKFDDEKSIMLKAQYALAERNWNKAYATYREIKEHSQDPEYFYRAKASAYMSGVQFPGNASQYKKTENVVFHQPDKQAKTVDNIVDETKKLIELIETRSETVNKILKNNKTLTPKEESEVDNG